MIIQIDDNYFNPLTITEIVQWERNVHVRFEGDTYITFKNWKVQDLAAEINRCIELFNDKP